MVIVGLVLAVLGLCLVSVGIVGAAFKVFAAEGAGFSATEQGIVDILNLLPKVLDAIAKAPNWLGMTAAGVILVLVGVGVARMGRPSA